QSRISAKRSLRFIVEDEAGDEEIELRVVVVIEPHGAGGPTRRRDARFLCYVSERAVAVVAIENILTVVRDVEIDVAVAIVGGSGDAHSEPAARDAGFVSDISERAVVVVAIERILEGR